MCLALWDFWGCRSCTPGLSGAAALLGTEESLVYRTPYPHGVISVLYSFSDNGFNWQIFNLLLGSRTEKLIAPGRTSNVFKGDRKLLEPGDPGLLGHPLSPAVRALTALAAWTAGVLQPVCQAQLGGLGGSISHPRARQGPLQHAGCGEDQVAAQQLPGKGRACPSPPAPCGMPATCRLSIRGRPPSSCSTEAADQTGTSPAQDHCDHTAHAQGPPAPPLTPGGRQRSALPAPSSGVQAGRTQGLLSQTLLPQDRLRLPVLRLRGLNFPGPK